MTSIDHANLSRLDLNLLVAFDALLTERSVTRAAARIGLGQSAMSHNLARLRTLFGDELLTRGADGMRPTPRALALADPVRVTLSQIQAAVLQREAFDPSTADRTFRIGLADSIEVAVIPSLLARLSETAPAVSLRLRPIDRRTILEDLDTGRLDLGIGVFDQGQIHHKRRALYSDNFLCLFNPARVNFVPPLSLEDYLSVPHVLTSLTDDAHGAVDQALAKLKLKRSIALTTPGFLAVPFVLRRAPVITTMPSEARALFRRCVRAGDKPCADRVADLHHLAALARKLRPRPGPCLAPPDGGWARFRGRCGALRPGASGVDKSRFARPSGNIGFMIAA